LGAVSLIEQAESLLPRNIVLPFEETDFSHWTLTHNRTPDTVFDNSHVLPGEGKGFARIGALTELLISKGASHETLETDIAAAAAPLKPSRHAVARKDQPL
jgi:hypothetical protein